MLFEQHDRKEDMGNSGTVKELQETLRSGKHITNSTSYQEARQQAEELENRLLKVRSWGGSYSEIEFSHDIKMILEGSGKIRPDRVMVL